MLLGISDSWWPDIGAFFMIGIGCRLLGAGVFFIIGMGWLLGTGEAKLLEAVANIPTATNIMAALRITLFMS